MHKQLHWALPIVLSAFLMASCEKVIEFDTSISNSELVLNAVPSAQQQLFVNLAYSHFFLDTVNGYPLGDASMVMSINGSNYYPSTQRGCNYFFDYTLQEDDSLFVTIDAGGRTITAHTTVPRMPVITNPSALTSDTGAFHLMLVNFNIDDHPDYKDYYCISIRQRDSGCRYSPYLDRYDTIDTTYATLFLCNDKALIDPQAAAEMSYSGFVPADRLLSSDEMFDGKRHNTTLVLILLRDTNEVQPYIHQYSLDVETVSPDRFRYLKDVANATSMMQMLTEPPAVYSNVQGALGIFAANARQRIPLITLTGGTRPPLGTE